MRTVFACGLLAIIASTQVVAAPAPACPTLTVTTIIADKAKIASASNWKRTETLDFIGRGMIANAKQMQPLFQQLADPACKKVKITTDAKTTATELSKPKAKSDAADLFAMWALPSAEAMANAMEVMWNDGASGFRKMTLFAQSTATSRTSTISFFGRKVRDAWGPSNLSNGYEPLNGMIKSRYELANAITDDAELKKWEVELIYRGVRLFDDFSDGRLPDHLYDYTKPTP